MQYLLQYIFFIIIVYAIYIEPSFIQKDNIYSKETFFFKQKAYDLYSTKVSWNEAEKICQLTNSKLVTIIDNNKNELKEFLINCMSLSWIKNIEEIWIGGKKINTIWYWHNDDQYISPFITQILKKDSNKNCLSLKSNGIYNADNCKKPNQFICELKLIESQMIQLAGVTQTNENQFFIYYGHLNWLDAVNFCNQQGLTLASIRDMQEVKVVAKALLKSRPSIKNAWIGGKLDDGNTWKWLDTGEQFQNSENFPPWNKLINNYHSCILFNLNNIKDATFISAPCTRTNNFICFAKLPTNTLITEVMDGKRMYTFIHGKYSWYESEIICRKINATLLNLLNLQEAKLINEIMNDNRNPIDHLWIGGRIINKIWKWSSTNKSIPFNSDNTGFPPWCIYQIDEELSCLNLDRSNNIPLMYGIECKSLQAVVCVKII